MKKSLFGKKKLKDSSKPTFVSSKIFNDNHSIAIVRSCDSRRILSTTQQVSEA